MLFIVQENAMDSSTAKPCHVLVVTVILIPDTQGVEDLMGLVNTQNIFIPLKIKLVSHSFLNDQHGKNEQSILERSDFFKNSVE